MARIIPLTVGMDLAALWSYRTLYKRAAEAEGDSSERFMPAERESWGEL